jgi:hypothetical protein
VGAGVRDRRGFARRAVSEFRYAVRLRVLPARIVFDDYDHPDYPGIREAIDALGLTGHAHGTVFVHEVPRS